MILRHFSHNPQSISRDWHATHHVVVCFEGVPPTLRVRRGGGSLVAVNDRTSHRGCSVEKCREGVRVPRSQNQSLGKDSRMRCEIRDVESIQNYRLLWEYIPVTVKNFPNIPWVLPACLSAQTVKRGGQPVAPDTPSYQRGDEGVRSRAPEGQDC